MIKEYRKGNLVDAFLEGKVLAIGHQCNCFNSMGSGIAREIKSRIPGAFSADLRTKAGDRNKLGTISRHGFCFNLYGQYDYGRGNKTYTQYIYLKSAMQEMYNTLIENWPERDSISVGFPKIGCGLGKGDWNRVEDIINEVFHDVDVYIYEL